MQPWHAIAPLAGAAYSMRLPALNTWRQRSICALMKSVSCSGVLPTIAVPIPVSRSLTGGLSSAFLISALSFVMISGGVP